MLIKSTTNSPNKSIFIGFLGINRILDVVQRWDRSRSKLRCSLGGNFISAHRQGISLGFRSVARETPLEKWPLAFLLYR